MPGPRQNAAFFVLANVMLASVVPARTAHTAPTDAEPTLAEPPATPAPKTAPRAPTWRTMTPAEIEAVIARVHAETPDTAARIVALSEPFLRAPYRFSPLGEGPHTDPDTESPRHDPDPLLRFDEADCLSLIETALAMARAGAPTLAAVTDTLNVIRYKNGIPAWRNRNHLMMAQWIPNNIARGFFRDVTREVGGGTVRTANKKIDAASWGAMRQSDRATLALDLADVPPGTYALDEIPLPLVPDLVDRFPHAAIINVVRVDAWHIPYRVTHTGIVVVRGGERFLRHATRTGPEMVVEERLANYVQRLFAYVNWPVSGINVLMPVTSASLAPAGVTPVEVTRRLRPPRRVLGTQESLD